MKKLLKKLRSAKGESQEEYWRNERYAFFEKFKSSPIVTCHHLGDAVETWVMSLSPSAPAPISR